jgi:hypothetical protein
LQRRLSELLNELETVSVAKSEIVLKRRWRGPDVTINKQPAGGRQQRQATA